MPARRLPGLLCGGLLVLLGLTACKKLPDQVPYQAIIMSKGGSDESDQYVIGGDLLLDGQAVGTLVATDKTGFNVNVDWTGPKDEVRAVLGGTYTIRLTGACGELILSAEGPNEVWQNRSENDLAKDVEDEGAIPIYVTPKIPKPNDLLVDWGSGTHEVQVGETTLKQGETRTQVFVEGCDAAPTVKVDGKEVGTLDLQSPVHLVSADAERCHQIREIPFGDHSGPLAETVVTTSQVTPLEGIPYYVFEEAPAVLTVPQGIDGTSVKELTGRACAPAADLEEAEDGEGQPQ